MSTEWLRRRAVVDGPSQGRRFTALQHAVPPSLSLPTRLYCARSCRAQAWTAVHMASTQRVACSTRTQAECWGCRVRAGRSLYHRSCCLELCYPRRTRPAAVGWVVCNAMTRNWSNGQGAWLQSALCIHRRRSRRAANIPVENWYYRRNCGRA